jgi:orotidine-5'-phosphate decarboxylase
MEVTSPICVALDIADEGTLKEMASATAPHVGVFKVGLTTFTALGPPIVADLAKTKPVFLDLKLHDIPQQVGGAVRSAERTGASFLTIHAAGGDEMVRAASEAADSVTILAVTILTSLDDDSLGEIGVSGPVEKAVLRLAELALENGVGGLVCSPLEVSVLRSRFGARSDGGPLLVVPGIRSGGGDGDDQKRTLGPREAIEAGADLIVVGRPITASADPAAAARSIAEELAH